MFLKLKELIFGKPPVERQHDFFGKIVFVGGETPQPDDYWENEQRVDGIKETLTVLIIAGIDG